LGAFRVSSGGLSARCELFLNKQRLTPELLRRR
jgi:hypothetical protein